MKFFISVISDFGTWLVAVALACGSWAMYRIWAGKKGWKASWGPKPSTSDPDLGWKGQPGDKWTNNRPQGVGDWYALHLGKPRVLAKIRVLTNELGGSPHSYQLEIKEFDTSQWFPSTSLRETDKVSGVMEDIIRPHKRITELRWTILAPYLDSQGRDARYGWSIRDIRITEVLFPWLPIRWWPNYWEHRKWWM